MLAARVAGLVVLGAMSVAYLTHASSLIVAREDGILRLLALTYIPVRSFQWDPSSGTRIGLGTRGPPGRREQHERAGAPGGQDRTARPCR
jgi:hypothetical protein